MKKVVSDRRASLDEETEIQPALRALMQKEFDKGVSVQPADQTIEHRERARGQRHPARFPGLGLGDQEHPGPAGPGDPSASRQVLRAAWPFPGP